MTAANDLPQAVPNLISRVRADGSNCPVLTALSVA
jgi:hypothetical protein